MYPYWLIILKKKTKKEKNKVGEWNNVWRTEKRRSW